MEKSRQYSFINNKHGFTVSFIYGQQVMEELSLIHNIGEFAHEFYKKTLLSSLQMINFLKAGESLGFYIDSEEPYYRFKIELSHSGLFRTLLLPEDFDDFPTELNGKCRTHKFMPNNEPYTSLLAFEKHPLEEFINEVIEKSYQSKSKVIVAAKDSNNSIMITKLPPSNVDFKIDDFEDMNLEEIITDFAPIIAKANQMIIGSTQSIIQYFEENDFRYLGSKEVSFHCPCSKERMIENLFTLQSIDRDSLFEDDSSIEIRCDYCNTIYTVLKTDLIKELQ